MAPFSGFPKPALEDEDAAISFDLHVLHRLLSVCGLIGHRRWQQKTLEVCFTFLAILTLAYEIAYNAHIILGRTTTTNIFDVRVSDIIHGIRYCSKTLFANIVMVIFYTRSYKLHLAFLQLKDHMKTPNARSRIRKPFLLYTVVLTYFIYIFTITITRALNISTYPNRPGILALFDTTFCQEELFILFARNYGEGFRVLLSGYLAAFILEVAYGPAAETRRILEEVAGVELPYTILRKVVYEAWQSRERVLHLVRSVEDTFGKLIFTLFFMDGSIMFSVISEVLECGSTYQSTRLAVSIWLYVVSIGVLVWALFTLKAEDDETSLYISKFISQTYLLKTKPRHTDVSDIRGDIEQTRTVIPELLAVFSNTCFGTRVASISVLTFGHFCFSTLVTWIGAYAAYFLFMLDQKDKILFKKTMPSGEGLNSTGLLRDENSLSSF